MLWRKGHKGKLLGHLLSAPFIWAPLPFFILSDIILEIYHQVCFPIYGLEKVKRSDYIQIVDRTKLKYLLEREKIGCMYCGYVNGLLLYQKEIAGRTESYWCGIMHQNKRDFKIDPNHISQKFPEFGNEKKFKEKYN